ncbi:MAG: hypothetical protein ACTS1X_13040 [Parasphingopyxis sp.]|uniref:hypothetical protein n=1 Tax=Parasphingopyxis sp. TaxID=1920299 RepID=UPI003F9FC4AA
MNNQLGLQHRLFAVVAAAAVSAMCVFGTVGPVQAGGANGPVQIASFTSPGGVA